MPDTANHLDHHKWIPPHGQTRSVTLHSRVLSDISIGVESVLGMELLLNLAWVLVAAQMFCLWLLVARNPGTDRRMQFVALALLLLALFPVISVTDDLQTSLNPAEADCCLRRDYACSTPHSICPPVAALPLPAFAGQSFGVLRVGGPGNPSAPLTDRPELAPVENRPPPAA